MSNICENYAVITSNQEGLLERLVEAFRDQRVADEFVPYLSGDGLPTTDRALAHREAGGIYEGVRVTEHSEQTVALDFDTRGSPPVYLYHELVEQGFSIQASWVELGCRLCGSFSGAADGAKTERYDIPFDADGAREKIPEDILNAFGVLEYIAEAAS